MKPNMPKHFLRFDEIEDVLSSLELLALTVPLVRKQASHWKWVMVAAHSSLQGAMVCALNDTASISILEKDCAREMLEWFDHREGERPRSVWQILVRCFADAAKQAAWMVTRLS
jgi:hypothetical protein